MNWSYAYLQTVSGTSVQCVLVGGPFLTASDRETKLKLISAKTGIYYITKLGSLLQAKSPPMSQIYIFSSQSLLALLIWVDRLCFSQ